MKRVFLQVPESIVFVYIFYFLPILVRSCLKLFPSLVLRHLCSGTHKIN